jgi:NRPS condensation-like uncharacterized protein
MFENKSETQYERSLTPPESYLFRAPFSIVSLIAIIKGKITHETLQDAVNKVQKRHINLRTRIRDDENHDSWFTTENVEDILVTSIQRESDDHWIKEMHRSSKTPFDFNARPSIRFILLQSPRISELLILCHHTICDGLSLAYLVRDIMTHLGDPEKEVEILPGPTPISKENLPIGLGLNRVFRFFVDRINKKWVKERVDFTQNDYLDLNKAYWANFTHKVIPVELNEEQTTDLVMRCKEEGTTVNSALTSAFTGALQCTVSIKPKLSKTAIAGNLRERLNPNPGEAMGFFAGALILNLPFDGDKGFWENARALNNLVQPLYTNKELFKEGLNWCFLEPSILEAFNYKLLGDLVPEEAEGYPKIHGFSQREDLISSLLKRNEMESRDKLVMGGAITNLTRMSFPSQYGSLELDRLFMNPGGAFPLSNILIVIGVVTCSGKLSMVIEYAEETIPTSDVEAIKNKAMQFLFD